VIFSLSELPPILQRLADCNMARFLEKWLGVLTVAGTIAVAVLRLGSGSRVSSEIMLGSIWAILAGMDYDGVPQATIDTR
jgi:hypothetical protein